MVCIGPGPGPKNVLVEFEDGSKTVVPYAIWKHKLSKQQGEFSLADGKKKYLYADGFIQKFGDKPAVNVREANGQTVRDVTIKSNKEMLIRITLWPELDDVELGEGYWLAVEGAYSSSGDNNQFHNISAKYAVSLSGKSSKEREVVNRPQADTGDEDVPF